MSFQVLVKTTPHMNGSYAYDLDGREAAEAFVQRPDVWWWVFPLDEDVLDGRSWRKGGAWAPVEHIASAVGISGDEFKRDEIQELKHVPLRPVTPEEEEDDDRW